MSEETKKYIRRYFRLEFLVCYDSLNDKQNSDELDKIVIGIGKIVSNKYKTKDVIQGKADHLIHRLIDEAMKRRFPDIYSGNINLKRYIKNFIRSNFFINYNDKTLNYIAERIALKINPLVDYHKLMNGDAKVDSQISTQYEVIYQDTLNRVHKYVKNYLIRYVYPMLDIDEVVVANDVAIKIMNDDKYNVVDLFTKKYDTMIEQMAYANRRKNEQNKPDSLRYILVYIVKELDDYLDHDELVALSMAIEETLREEGAITKDIVGHRCDDKIRKMYNLYMMKKNSVYEEDKPRKIKYNPIVKKILKMIMVLVLVSVLVVSSVLSVASVLFKWVRDFYEEKSADWTYSSVSSQMVGDRYDTMFTKYSDQYESNMDSVVRVYNEFSELGEGYGYLGFYEAYKHTYGFDRLAIMDALLEEINRKITDDRYIDKDGTMDTQLDINTSYFVQFAYDRLVEMGCEEVQQEKYINAVKGYKSASWKNDDKNKTTMKYIEETDSELYDTIVEMMELYHQYSSKYYKELSEIYVPNGTKGRS